jgi:hypothetical protein
MPVWEHKRSVHGFALVCEMEVIFANQSEISRILFASSEYQTVFGKHFVQLMEDYEPQPVPLSGGCLR